MKPIIASFVVSMLAAAAAFAQGTAFTYQGRLTEGGGPANGVYDFTFTLYDASSGGGTLGASNVVNDLGVTNGIFATALDFGASSFDGNERWLEITVRPGFSSGAYTNLSPRQPIASTPYAIRAANLSGTVAASQLTGAISSNNIGAGSITTTMLAAGAVGSNQLAANAVTTSAIADDAVTAAKVAAVSNWLFVVTIPNPEPASGDAFGYSAAAVGNDRILMGVDFDDTGAVDSGVAHLLNTNGTLLMTFTNPTPAFQDNFGYAVAAVGNGRVLIGAYHDDASGGDAGAAYLFSTNGTLLTTFINPTPGNFDRFGVSVAALGTDRILIGADGDSTGADGAGAAYLFRTNGTLLTTFTNPTPAIQDAFGMSVAALGNDRILIGAPNAGAAYLFHTNGMLLATFTNPAPPNSDSFGWSVAALGTDRILIGAYTDDTGAAGAGAAYLFRTNGTLLTAFTNPTPAALDYFGFSVAALGTDRVLIGSHRDSTSASHAGAAYLFGTNGVLLHTFNNPTPSADDRFGYVVVAVGSNRVLIGADGDDAGAGDAGAAYLFSLDSYTPGLVAEGVKLGSITTANLANGAVTADKIGGVLLTEQIPDLDASKITSGTLADARLSANVALLNRPLQTFTGSTNNFNGRVGIGTASPVTKLHVVGGTDAGVTGGGYIVSGSTTGGNIVMDDNEIMARNNGAVSTLYLNVEGGTVAIGTNAADTNAKLHVVESRSSATSTAIIEASSTTGTWLSLRNASAGGRDWSLGSSGSNSDEGAGKLLFRDQNAIVNRMVIAANGNVGIGTDNPGFTLEVNGSAGKPGGGSWTVASDRRLKKNVRPLSGALDKLLAIHGVNFEYIDPAKINELSGERMGLIAQEVEKVFPDWVETGKDGYKRVTVRGLEALVVEALRELQAKHVDEMKRRDTENSELRGRLEKLERLFSESAGSRTK